MSFLGRDGTKDDHESETESTSSEIKSTLEDTEKSSNSSDSDIEFIECRKVARKPAKQFHSAPAKNPFNPQNVIKTQAAGDLKPAEKESTKDCNQKTPILKSPASPTFAKDNVKTDNQESSDDDEIKIIAVRRIGDTQKRKPLLFQNPQVFAQERRARALSIDPDRSSSREFIEQKIRKRTNHRLSSVAKIVNQNALLF